MSKCFYGLAIHLEKPPFLTCRSGTKLLMKYTLCRLEQYVVIVLATIQLRSYVRNLDTEVLTLGKWDNFGTPNSHMAQLYQRHRVQTMYLHPVNVITIQKSTILPIVDTSLMCSCPAPPIMVSFTASSFPIPWSKLQFSATIVYDDVIIIWRWII
jgi:hypothetical protein